MAPRFSSPTRASGRSFASLPGPTRMPNAPTASPPLSSPRTRAISRRRSALASDTPIRQTSRNAAVCCRERKRKLGWRASDTRELIFQDAIVPKENVLGPVNNGFRQFLHTLDGGRIGIAALALGLAEGALEESLTYTSTRKQFGRPVAHFQGVHFALADMATEIEAAKQLVYHAAWLKQRGSPFKKEAAMAKLYASELCMRATTKAVQLHGVYGYTTEYPVERMMRDAKICEIGEGTSEIQRVVIARQLLGGLID